MKKIKRNKHRLKMVNLVEIRPVTVLSVSIPKFISLLDGRKYTPHGYLQGVHLCLEEFRATLRQNRAYFDLPNEYRIVSSGYGQITRIYSGDQEFNLDIIFSKLKAWLESQDAND